MKEITYTNAKVVLAESVIDGTVVAVDGFIADVVKGRNRTGDAIDFEGDHVGVANGAGEVDHDVASDGLLGRRLLTVRDRRWCAVDQRCTGVCDEVGVIRCAVITDTA